MSMQDKFTIEKPVWLLIQNLTRTLDKTSTSNTRRSPKVST